MKEPQQKIILIVEDDESTSRWIKLSFLKQGYDVLTADCPEKAWKMIQNKECNIDLAYIDVNYGNKSQHQGFWLAEKIKNQPGLGINYFIMSMDDDNDYHEKAETAGALGFVEKNENFLISSLAIATEAIYNSTFKKAWGNWKENDFIYAKRIHSTTKDRRMDSKYWQVALG